VRPALVVLATLGLVLLVLVVVLPNLWYGFHDVSDIPVYQAYTDQIAQGLTPYLDFDLEYPPLAPPSFRLAGARLTLEAYMRNFSLEMGIVTLIAGVLVALAACAVWPRGRRAYVAGALYALGVALTGAIIVNRFDVAVALVVAAFLLCLVRRWHTAAAVVLGLGFALKITPAALLPLVLLLAGNPRRWLWPLAGFGGAALAGFMPYLVTAPRGVWHVFQYHLERPLQIESVLGTPMLLGQALGAAWVTVGHSYGSHQLIATGADIAADLSGVLTLGALVVVYVELRATARGPRAAPTRRPHAPAGPPDLRQGPLAAVLHLDPAGPRSRRREGTPSRLVGRGRAAADPDRVPGAVLGPRRPAAPGRRAGRGQEPPARGVLRRGGVAAVEVEHRTHRPASVEVPAAVAVAPRGRLAKRARRRENPEWTHPGRRGEGSRWKA